MTTFQQAFVAYPSTDAKLAEDILDAVRHANAKSSAISYEPWEFNDVAGRPLISPILERINESLFVVADITYLNLNVVYEIGFTIGSRKRAFLRSGPRKLNSGISGNSGFRAGPESVWQ